MIVLKKVHIFALFTLLSASFAGLLQGGEENTLSRGWQSVSEMGTKILQCPYTYYAAAPLTLYAGYKLASIPLKITNDYALKNSLWVWPAAAASSAAYYAPTFGLTELMRKYRSTITPTENEPSKWHYFGPALVQSLIVSKFLLSHDYANGVLSALLIASLVNPAIITGTISSCKEYDAEQGQQRTTRQMAFEARMRSAEERAQAWAGNIQANEELRQQREEAIRQIQQRRIGGLSGANVAWPTTNLR